MSTAGAAAAPAPAGAAKETGKKAVHVKWAGKTIALGTFPASEADEKCARAKALTRAWRSTMRPKPSRDWVMLELERLGVRVVSGRLGRKAGEEEEGADKKAGGVPPGIGGVGVGVGGPPAERSNSIGWGSPDADLNLMMARRNSSLGLSMMNDGRRGSLSSLGQAVGLDAGDPTMPPHRPLVGGGAAAAYEAARHDHFTQKSAEQQRRASSLGLGSLAGGGIGNMGGMSVNPNQHYEMLKLHHMNLLNEIQETTLMMNLYQQQQLQQQQQQLQQQATDQMGGGNGPSGGGGGSGSGGAGAGAGSASGAASGPGGAGDVNNMAMLLQQQGSGPGQPNLDMFAGQLNQRASLGLGGSQLGAGPGNFGSQQLQMLQQQQQLMQGGQQAVGGANQGSNQVQGGGQGQGGDQQQLEGRIAQLKQEIAQSNPGDGDPSGKDDKSPSKRPAEGDNGDVSKRLKVEDAPGKDGSAKKENV